MAESKIVPIGAGAIRMIVSLECACEHGGASKIQGGDSACLK